MGIDGLSAVLKAVCQCANVFSKLINKQGLLTLLGLQAPVAVLGSTDWKQVVAEVKDLSKDERLALEKVVSDNFAPVNPSVDVGVDKFIAIGEKTATLIEKDVAEGKDMYESAKGLVAEWKAFLGAA